VLAPNRRQYIFGDSAGEENQVIVADLSNLSNMAAREQGVKVIKERQIPFPVDILMKMQSSGNLSDFVSGIVKDFIDKENSSIQAPVVQKSVIEKPTNNPCKDLPICDVVGQDTVRPSQAEIVEPNSPCKSTETKSSTSTLGGQQNIGKTSGCTATDLTGLKTGLTGSSGVLQNKAKPKMVKPKKQEIGIWKTVEAKGRRKHQKEKPKPVLGELQAKSRKQNNDASRSKNSKQAKSVPKQKFYDR